MNLVDLIAFYGFHFNDYFSTTLGLRTGATELNPIARHVVYNPLRFAVFKFGLATLLLLYVHFMTPQLAPAIYYDSVIEAFVTWWNTLTLYRLKRGGRK